MKRVLSFLFVIVMLCGMIPPAIAASDEATAAAEKLHSLGLFNGTGTDANGSPIYDLDRMPTRHEAVTMLVRLLGKGEAALAGTWETPFTDVADWARPYVGYAYANGLTSGTGKTTFGGDGTVTASQYITFVLRALGYESGKDFQWDKAWELSDAIGLTSGKYSAETTLFTRGDIATISCNALNINCKGTVVSLEQKITEEKLGGYRAWYEVDDLGGLYIKTNIDGREWDGYSLVIRFHFGNGDLSHDTQSGAGDTVDYSLTSLFSYYGNAVVTRMQMWVFKGAQAREEYWQLQERKGHEAAIAELSEKLIAEFEIDTHIRIEEKDADFALTDLLITHDEDAQAETYTASITGEIAPTGAYGLIYRGKTGDWNAGLSYIGRGDGVLTFTREIHHFASPGATGTFHISYCIHAISGENEIICTRYLSNGIDYSF